MKESFIIYVIYIGWGDCFHRKEAFTIPHVAYGVKSYVWNI